MLEEHHRVVASDRSAQQAGRIDGVRRERDAYPRAVGEDAFSRLAVIRAAAAKVSADRDADDHRAGEVVRRPIAQHRHLVANLHHRRPDVIEELDLDDRLEAAGRHADRPADDAGFGERRVEHPIVAVQTLQAVRQLEDAALARHDRQRFLAAGFRDVLAEHDDARIARHLVLERAIDRRHHRVGLALRLRRRLEGARRRVDVRREQPERGGVLRRLRRGQRRERRVVDFLLYLRRHCCDLGVGREAVLAEELREARDRVAPRFRVALRRRLVKLLIV